MVITGAGSDIPRDPKRYMYYADKRIAKVDDKYFRLTLKNHGNNKKRIRSKLQPGDSGGGVYKRIDDNTLELIGINSQLLPIFYYGHASVVDLTNDIVRDWILSNLD